MHAVCDVILNSKGRRLPYFRRPHSNLFLRPEVIAAEEAAGRFSWRERAGTGFERKHFELCRRVSPTRSMEERHFSGSESGGTHPMEIPICWLNNIGQKIDAFNLMHLDGMAL